MRRKSKWLSVGILSFLAFGTIAVLLWLVRHEPAFYQALEIEPGHQRKLFSTECQKSYFKLMNSIINNESSWMASFSADEINSFLQEDFPKQNDVESMMPEGFHSPRISIENDKIRLAMRYGSGLWQTVITLEIHLWLVAKEPNVLAIELQGLYAGSLPFPTKSLLDWITDAAAQNNIEVKWYRNSGNPVGLMRFQADQIRPTVQLKRLQLLDGTLLIAGRSLYESRGANRGAE